MRSVHHSEGYPSIACPVKADIRAKQRAVAGATCYTYAGRQNTDMSQHTGAPIRRDRYGTQKSPVHTSKLMCIVAAAAASLLLQDKQAESLRERLVVRLQLGGPREWRLVAWCIGQLGYSEKGLRRIMELVACYRHTLGEQQVGWAAPMGTGCRCWGRVD